MKKTLFRNGLILGAALLIAACSTQSFDINKGISRDVTLEAEHHFFVGGIAQQEIEDVAKICRGAENIIRVETELTPLNWFLSWITFGIYTPHHYRVYCKE